MDARSTVAFNIRRLRVALKLPQEVLAIDAGVDRSYVSRLERGLENPTVAVLERLASALQMDIGELFKRPPQGSRRLAENLPRGRKARLLI